MARFQVLTPEELQELEKEFVEFLVLQGIMADDWVRIKAEEPVRAQKCIEQFSDVVYGSVMMQIEYLEMRTPKSLYAYHCQKGKIVLIGLESHEPDTDFTDPAFIERAIVSPPKDLAVFKSEKEYQQLREDEVFQMLSNGCTTSDGILFETLKKSAG